jgi:hypothetical protein
LPVSAIDAVSPAFERMKLLLFRPFRFGQWLRFALVGFLAGEMGGAGGCSFRLPMNFPGSSDSRDQFQFPGSGRGAAFILGLALAVLLIFVLALVFAYISSRMRFVLFDSVVDGQCQIRHSWNRRGAPAFRYFIFQIVIGLVGLVSLAVLIGLPILFGFSLGLFQNPRQHLFALIFGGLIVGLVFLVWLIFFILLQVLTKDFVVPQMALEDVTPSEAWGRLWAQIKAEKGGYAGYIGMKVALSLAAAVVLGIITFVVILVLLIPVGGIGVITVLGGRAAGLSWNPLTIAIAIVVGALILAAVILISSLISVPAIVFFPAYSISFLADRYPQLRALLYPPAPLPPELSNPSPQP